MLDLWNPFAEMSRLEDEVWGRTTNSRRPSFQPRVDIFEDKEAILVQAELPGTKSSEINIQVENNVLTLSGERKLERDDPTSNYHRIERSYGTFTRSFMLPNTVDSTNIEADLTDGVLTLKLPRRAEAQPRKIQVKSGQAKTQRTVEIQAKQNKGDEPRRPEARG